MCSENKNSTKMKIEALKLENMTNLWAGIQQGLKLFNPDPLAGNVASLMVLTDGVPNHMHVTLISYTLLRLLTSTRCPSRGYVPKLRSMGQLPATIHTFGFGYNLRSDLLKSIAEVGGGNYSFIPDAGMIVGLIHLY